MVAEGLMHFVAPVLLLTAAIGASVVKKSFVVSVLGGARSVVGGFFGGAKGGGRRKSMALVLILIGLLVLIPQFQLGQVRHEVKIAKTEAEKKDAEAVAALLRRDVAEQQLQRESDARAIERANYERSIAASDKFVAEKSARELTIENRMKEISNALKSRAAGDAARGDSAVILRNLGKVGIEAVGSGTDNAAGKTGAAPMPDVLSGAASAGPNAGPVGSGTGSSSVDGIRGASQASGG